ncbi:MAG: hypothetical protein P8J18_07695, partial [Halieaceae bacterium]|nr:hypothetical protein [Halieaceae bacterium]
MFRVFGLACFFFVVLTSCGKSVDSQDRKSVELIDPAVVNALRLTTENQDGNNWMSHGRTYSEQRHSPLSQIDIETIS